MLHPAPATLTTIDKRRTSVSWALDWRYARPGAGNHRGALCDATAASKQQQALTDVKSLRQGAFTHDGSDRRPQDVAAPDVSRAPVVANAQSAARSLFAALNHRDVSAVLSLLADDVTYENLGSSTVLRGRAAVGRFYLEALAALPEDAVFVLEGPCGPGADPWVGDGGPILQAGVAWRVELGGMAVPLSRGVGVYWADPRTGRLARIWDNPEHTVKQSSPSLTSAAWASPLMRELGPLVMPAAMSVGSFLTTLSPSGGGGGGGGASSGEASTSGMAAASGGGGGGGGLAGSVISTLSSMMPFQPQGPAAAAAAASRGGGSKARSGGGGGPGGGGQAAIYRDHTRGEQAVAAAAASTAAAAAAAASGGSGGGGGGGRAGVSAMVPKAQLGGPNGSSQSRPMLGGGAPASSSAGAAGASSGGAAVAAPAARGVSASSAGTQLVSDAPKPVAANAPTVVRHSGDGGGNNDAADGLRAAIIPAPSPSAAVPAAAAATAAVAAAAATATAALSKMAAGVPAAAAVAATAAAAAVARDAGNLAVSSAGEPIRMRLLPDPLPPTGAAVSVAASFASTDDGVDGALIASSSLTSSTTSTSAQAAAAATPPPTPSAAAAAASAASASNAAPQSFPPSASSNNKNASGGSGSAGGSGGSGGSGGGDVAFGSVDSGSGTDSEEGGPAALPFSASTSLAVNLTGLWEKDVAASQVEEYESMLDVLELGGLQKVTARLIDGLDVRQDEQRFEVSFVTVVPFFRVTEKSRFDGSTAMMRRDLRSGRQTAQAARIPGGVSVDMSWEAPLAGSLREEYVVSEAGGQMAVTSSIRIGARSAVATQVYRRSSRNKSDFLASKRSSYGSMEDVLKSQEKKFGKIN